MSTPSDAPRPAPTIRAVGVASPSAHGQAMISTATAAIRPPVASPTASHQTAKVAVATASTTGTKMAATWSTSRCTGARLACACSTRRTICASAVSRPTAVARTVSAPLVFIVAPATVAPGVFSTGIDSPVSIDSSTAEAPSMTTPSTGTFSPGRTRTRSPTCTCSTGTIRSSPSTSRRASLAPSSSNARIARDARERARASK